MKLLVFPCDCETDLEKFMLIEKLGVEVVGASSSKGNHFLGKDSLFLPYISDPCFWDEFVEVVSSNSITNVYTGHAGVWGIFKEHEHQLEKDLGVFLSSEYPFDIEWNRFEKHFVWGQHLFDKLQKCGLDKRFSVEQVASLCMNYNQIPGQSDNQKLEALIYLAQDIPDGDWVEIGSLYGKSAYALGILASHFGNSSLICIDPWDIKEIKPQEGKAAVLDAQADIIDVSKIFAIFKSSISLLKNVTYIQSSSEKALPKYLEGVFDGLTVPASKQIAFLHIDGNHHFDEVTKDIKLWEPHVCVGGWIAVDDYLWAFGDGPRRAGDNLLQTGRFDIAYVAGDTLYMRKAICD